jgi:hypothetical protein
MIGTELSRGTNKTQAAVFDADRLHAQLEHKLAGALHELAVALDTGKMDGRLTGFHPWTPTIDRQANQIHFTVKLHLSAPIRRYLDDPPQHTPAQLAACGNQQSGVLLPKVCEVCDRWSAALTEHERRLDMQNAKEQTPAAATPQPTQQQDGSGPSCASCGSIAVRAGSCYCCPTCGSTTGCS